MSLIKKEQETIVSYNRADKEVVIDTYNAHDIRRFMNNCSLYPEDYRFDRYYRSQDKEILGARFILSSRNLISFRKPRKKRTYTEEQKVAIGERLLQGRRPEQEGGQV